MDHFAVWTVGQNLQKKLQFWEAALFATKVAKKKNSKNLEFSL